MNRRDVWRALGIARTTDIAAIRRAYAQALRAMDPDADPDAFARLRTARDTALALARDAQEQAGPEPVGDDEATAFSADMLSPLLVPGDDVGTLAVAVGTSPIGPISDARPDSGEGRPVALSSLTLDAPIVAGVAGDVTVTSAATIGRMDRAYAEVVELLHGGRVNPSRRLDGSAEARLVALVDLLLTDPRLDQISFGEDAARWFADVLADAIPRSDAVLGRVAARFGWDRAADTIDLSPAAQRIAERARSVAYVAAVRQPGHRDHRVWTLLDGTAARWTMPFVRQRRVRDVLATIRRTYPDAEHHLDPARVARWDTGAIQGPPRWIWVVGVVMLLSAIAQFAHDDGRSTDRTPAVTAPAPVSTLAPVADRDRDLDLALLSFAEGFTLQRVRRERPLLAAALEERWRLADARGERLDQFIDDTRRHLQERFRGALLRASYAEAATLRRMDLDEMTLARERGADICTWLLSGDLPLAQVRTPAEDSGRRQMMARMILANPSAPPPKRGATFRIPGDVMARLQRDTRLRRKALNAALDLRGPNAARCDARIALLKEALDLPTAKGLPLLRAM